jgi:lipoprotein-releasing system permease protein
MYRPLSLFVGLRYTRAKRRNHFISFISFVSIAGIALGITALITVMSVMNGFERELRERILGMTAHASVSAFEGSLQDWGAVVEQAGTHSGVLAAAPFVRSEAMISHAGRVSGTVLRGVLPEFERRVADLDQHMVGGRFDALRDGSYGLVLGRELARALGASLGDKVTVVTPETNVTPAGISPRLRRFEVVGIFEIGMYEYDRSLAFLHMGDAQRLFRLGEGVDGVRLRLRDMFAAPRLVREVAADLGGTYLVSDWTREHANFFRAVQIEKTAMFVILTLIVAVAAFNIVSTLVMVVTDKQGDIAILRTIGASPGTVMLVFMVQGVAIGLFGTLIGIAAGVALASNVEVVVPFIERLIGIKFLAPDVYYISDLPSQLEWGDVLGTGVVAFLLATLATLYPSWRAARTRPAEALSYE